MECGLVQALALYERAGRVDDSESAQTYPDPRLLSLVPTLQAYSALVRRSSHALSFLDQPQPDRQRVAEGLDLLG